MLVARHKGVGPFRRFNQGGAAQANPGIRNMRSAAGTTVAGAAAGQTVAGPTGQEISDRAIANKALKMAKGKDAKNKMLSKLAGTDFEGAHYDDSGKLVGKDGKEIKGKQKTELLNALSGKLDDKEKKSAEGRIQRNREIRNVIAKTALTAAVVTGTGVAMAAGGPLAGLLVGGKLAAGGFLAKKGMKLGRQYKNADDATRAQYIKKWGGNVLKVAGAGALALATGGGSIALQAAVAGTTGVLVARHKGLLRSPRNISGASEQFARPVAARATAGTANISGNQTTAGTMVAAAGFGGASRSEIAQMIREAVKNELALEGRNKERAAAYVANNMSVNDSNFVSNIDVAIANVVRNSVATQGGQKVVAEVLAAYSNNTGGSAGDLLDPAQKLALYKSAMSDEQRSTFESMGAQGKVAEQIDFIENQMKMKLNINADKDRVGFSVENGGAVSAEASNDALRQMLNHDSISDEMIARSAETAGYAENARQALAENYALGVNYSKEKSGDAVPIDKHQEVFDRAAQDENIVAEAIYAYMQTKPGMLDQFKADYHIDDKTDMSVILDSIKSGISTGNGLFASIKPEDYKQQLSEATQRHVADGSFKVQAYSLMTREEQIAFADHNAANIAAAASGAKFGKTEEEQAAERELSSEEFGNKELVYSLLHSEVENKTQIISEIASKLGVAYKNGGAADIATIEAAIEKSASAAKDAALVVRDKSDKAQIAGFASDSSANGFNALSTKQQNEILVMRAVEDTQTRRELEKAGVDVGSAKAIETYLNSSAGESIRERLVSMSSGSLYSLRSKLSGKSDEATYAAIQQRADEARLKALYEKVQGELISSARVKEQIENSGNSTGATNVANAAAGMMDLLTDAEKKAIADNAKVSGTNKGVALSEARQNALFNGGAERQRAVADIILKNDTLFDKARTAFNAANPGKDLSLVSEIERNNYLFKNYATLVSGNQDAKKAIDEIMGKYDVLAKKADGQAAGDAVKSLNQAEFDAVVKAMGSTGAKAVSESKQGIIGKELQSGGLTPVADESRMSREELKEYRAFQAELQQHLRRNPNSEYLANVYRTTTFINDSETIRSVLSNFNPNASQRDIDAAKLEALKNNVEFVAGARLAVIARQENAATLEAIKGYLKKSNIDYDKLSDVEKSKAIERALSDQTFVKNNKIDVTKFNGQVDGEIVNRALHATNEQIKAGMTLAQIGQLLAKDEKTKEVVVKTAAYSPAMMVPNPLREELRMYYIFNNPVLRKIITDAVISQMYNNAQLKEFIKKEILSKSSSMYNPNAARMKPADLDKYINSNFARLKSEFGQSHLFEKKGDTFVLRKTVDRTVVNNTINNTTQTNKTFEKTVNRGFGAVLASIIASRKSNDVNVNAMADMIKNSLASDQGFIDRIKQKIEFGDQFAEFLRTGQGRYITEISTRNVLDRMPAKVQGNAYVNHNKDLQRQITQNRNRINSLQRQLKVRNGA